MKIYVCHSSSFDFKNELYLPLRNSKLNEENEIILPHEIEGQFINSKEIIRDSDLILAEVSFCSTGQGIELGWAEMFEKRVIFIYKTVSKFSSSLKVVSDEFIEYEDMDDLIDKLSQMI